MATVEVTDQNFREIYTKNKIVVLDFWATWCHPCHQYFPIFESVSNQFPEIIFGKVDTEQQLNLGQYFTIRSIPTTLIIREELELFRHSGALAQADLVDIIKKVKFANMDEVRQKIEIEENQLEERG